MKSRRFRDEDVTAVDELRACSLSRPRAVSSEKRARVAPRAVGVKDEGEAFVRVSHVVRFGLGGETEGVVVGHGVRRARFFVPGTTATTGTGTGTGEMGDR